MLVSLFSYLWPTLAPCLSAVYTALGLGSIKPAAPSSARSLTRESPPPRKSLSKHRKWSDGDEWDEEERLELVPRAAPPVALLRQRHGGIPKLGQKECAERLATRRTMWGPGFEPTQRPSVPLCVGFEAEVAYTFCFLAGVDTSCDTAFVGTVLKILQLLHCCGYSWDITLMTLSVGLVYANSPLPGASRHGKDCACAGVRSRRGMLDETLCPCSSFLEQADAGSGSTRTCKSTYGAGSPGQGCETTPEERSLLAQKRIVVLLFLAHTYLVDDPCFLCTWNKYVFQDRLDIEDLNGELMRCFKARGYDLKVESSVVLPLYERLEQTVRGHPTGAEYNLAGSDDSPA